MKKCIVFLLCLLSFGGLNAQSKNDKEVTVPKLAVRTNVVHWLMASPNMGLEWRPAESVGILFSGSWTHLNWSGDSKHFRHYKLNPEVRFYLGERRNFYLGGQFHMGQANIKLGDTGRQGDFMGGGLSTGYMLRTGKSMWIDFNIGLGMTKFDYDSYKFENGVNTRIERGLTKNIYGLNQVGISLVWKIF